MDDQITKWNEEQRITFGHVYAEYIKYASSEPIMEVGYNDETQIIWIALENGICICKIVDDDCEVMYFVSLWDKEEEIECETYTEAEQIILSQVILNE